MVYSVGIVRNRHACKQKESTHVCSLLHVGIVNVTLSLGIQVSGFYLFYSILLLTGMNHGFLVACLEVIIVIIILF